jgi:anti-sigma factor RsiW
MATNSTVEQPVIRQRRAETVAPFRRERQDFGGRIQWEAVLFGLLAGIGLAGSLIARPVVWP